MQKTSLVCGGVRMLAAIAVLGTGSLWAAELIYQEGFNTDGETEGRYVMSGRDVYEVPRIQSELANFDQKGPLYWEHNFNVSFVGNPDILSIETG